MSDSSHVDISTQLVIVHTTVWQHAYIARLVLAHFVLYLEFDVEATPDVECLAFVLAEVEEVFFEVFALDFAKRVFHIGDYALEELFGQLLLLGEQEFDTACVVRADGHVQHGEHVLGDVEFDAVACF